MPANFKEAGYKIPQTMEELKALTEQIVKDGGTPWCIGLGSQAATGWPATDWVEDFMLRLNPPDVYDGWVNNTVKFNDPRVIKAIDEFGWFAKNDKFVDGGAAAVASTDFRDSPKGLFTSPPKCYMHRQASFIPAFFPEGTKLGTDANFFYFPPYASERSRQPGSRWRHAVRHHQGLACGARLHRIPGDADCFRGRHGRVELLHAVQAGQPGRLSDRHAEGREQRSSSTPRPSASTGRT